MSDQPEFDREGPVPIYLQIEDWVRQNIASGAWPGNYKLLAEADLAAELQVSRGTVRRAIADLTSEGLLMRTHGKGTFVASNVLQQPLAERLVTFSEDLISKGIPFRTKVLTQEVILCSRRLRALLSIAVDEKLLFLRRIRYVNDEPLILLNNYVVYASAPGIENVDFKQHRLFEILETGYGLTLAGGSRTFQAQPANAETASLLDTNQAAPVMYMEQLTHLQSGAPVEFSEIWIRGDRFRLTASVNRTQLDAAGVVVSVLDDR
ncbi:MAG: GntR family transcriptional regulator [Chloroflexi bacterium]|nr:GntR family transcriptional regulator [Chloroflexota bacterium]